MPNFNFFFTLGWWGGEGFLISQILVKQNWFSHRSFHVAEKIFKSLPDFFMLKTPSAFSGGASSGPGPWLGLRGVLGLPFLYSEVPRPPSPCPSCALLSLAPCWNPGHLRVPSSPREVKKDFPAPGAGLCSVAKPLTDALLDLKASSAVFSTLRPFIFHLILIFPRLSLC